MRKPQRIKLPNKNTFLDRLAHFCPEDMALEEWLPSLGTNKHDWSRWRKMERVSRETVDKLQHLLELGSYSKFWLDQGEGQPPQSGIYKLLLDKWLHDLVSRYGTLLDGTTDPKEREEIKANYRGEKERKEILVEMIQSMDLRRTAEEGTLFPFTDDELVKASWPLTKEELLDLEQASAGGQPTSKPSGPTEDELFDWRSALLSDALRTRRPPFKTSKGDWLVSIGDTELGKVFVVVPTLHDDLAASGGLVSDEILMIRHAFDRVWLHDVASSPNNLAIAKVKGDSMWPTVCDGDVIVVDRGQRVIEEGKIYAIHIGKKGWVKRLQEIGEDQIRISSDNKLAKGGKTRIMARKDVHIIGRVIRLVRDKIQ